MEIIRGLGGLPALPHGSAVTIGNFDGVHLAHQRLLRRIAEMAHAFGGAAIAVSFEPHPARVLAPERAPKTLTTLAQKAKQIAQYGADFLVVLPFTQELSRLSPAEFVRGILVERLRARALCVGSNFHFGHRQAGNTETLAELSRAEGFSLEIVPTVQVRGQTVSSSRIRQLLADGRVQMAGRLLGRPFSNTGRIVRGAGIGHRETAPTLNLAPLEEQLPRTGVYVSRTLLGGASCASVTNVGCRPTFGQHPINVETHLLKLGGAIDPDEMEVEYLHRLRDEIKFPNPAALKRQIQNDVHRSERFFHLLDHFRSKTTSPSLP
ncbi:MAG: bifunctional riboflavin kinase/FAD synthetase [Terriglobia bacterium]